MKDWKSENDEGRDGIMKRIPCILLAKGTKGVNVHRPLNGLGAFGN